MEGAPRDTQLVLEFIRLEAVQARAVACDPRGGAEAQRDETALNEGRDAVADEVLDHVRALVEHFAALRIRRASGVEQHGENTSRRLGIARRHGLPKPDEIRRAQRVVDDRIEDWLSAPFEDRFERCAPFFGASLIVGRVSWGLLHVGRTRKTHGARFQADGQASGTV